MLHFNSIQTAGKTASTNVPTSPYHNPHHIAEILEINLIKHMYQSSSAKFHSISIKNVNETVFTHFPTNRQVVGQNKYIKSPHGME